MAPVNSMEVKMLTAYDLLTEAQESIRDPARWWGHDQPASDAEQHDGRRRCAIQATALAHGSVEAHHEAVQALADASYWLFNLPAYKVNDEVGHEAVMHVFDAARERLGIRESLALESAARLDLDEKRQLEEWAFVNAHIDDQKHEPDFTIAVG